MSEVDYRNYKSLFEVLASFLRKPDLIIYLKVSPESALGRILRRGRASERGITLDYLVRLDRAYDEWIARVRHEIEVLQIDTDRVHLQGDVPGFRELVANLKARYPRQSELHL
jgi:deoxyadenosine/deoxycytidine kinase